MNGINKSWCCTQSRNNCLNVHGYPPKKITCCISVVATMGKWEQLRKEIFRWTSICVNAMIKYLIICFVLRPYKINYCFIYRCFYLCFIHFISFTQTNFKHRIKNRAEYIVPKKLLFGFNWNVYCEKFFYISL